MSLLYSRLGLLVRIVAWPHLWPSTASDYVETVRTRASESIVFGLKSIKKSTKLVKKRWRICSGRWSREFESRRLARERAKNFALSFFCVPQRCALKPKGSRKRSETFSGRGGTIAQCAKAQSAAWQKRDLSRRVRDSITVLCVVNFKNAENPWKHWLFRLSRMSKNHQFLGLTTCLTTYKKI